jgi:hypothetical protein
MLLLAAVLIGAAGPAEAAADMPLINPASQAKQCPETPMSLARKLGRQKPQAIPLNRLPPAQTFMAVDRRIAGCPAPLTMIDYRGAGQR